MSRHLLPLRAPLLLAAVVVAVGAGASPSAAQKAGETGVVMTGSFAEPQFQVYRRAFRSLESQGFELQAGLIDRGLLTTLPQRSGRQYVQVMVQLDSSRDSTHLSVAARLTNARGEPTAGQDAPQNLSKIIITETLVLHGITGDVAGSPASGLPAAPKVPPLVARHGYGYDEASPVRVGGDENGHEAEVAYLASLRGPDGQPAKYARLGSCCEFAWQGDPTRGRLDAWEVTYEGAPGPVVLYLDMYRREDTRAPEGFTGGVPAPTMKPAAAS
jgi:hypothetical protein